MNSIEPSISAAGWNMEEQREEDSDRADRRQERRLPALPLALAQGGEVADGLEGERQGSHGWRRHRQYAVMLERVDLRVDAREIEVFELLDGRAVDVDPAVDDAGLGFLELTDRHQERFAVAFRHHRSQAQQDFVGP